MIPISDDNPVQERPIVTWALIGVCVVIALWQLSLPDAATERVFRTYGAVPANIFGTGDRVSFFFPPELTLVSSQFLHGGLGHLFGNMLYLYIFGDNIEAAMGRVRYLAFYLLAGIAAALGHGLLAPSSDIPMVGASGAISGVLGAYLLLYPHARVRVLFLPLPIPIFRVIAIPAVMVLGIWFLIQFVSAAISPADQGGIAFWAHVAGFAAGMGLLPLFKKRTVPYWQAAAVQRFDGRRAAGPWTRVRLRRGDRDDKPRQGRRGPWG